MIKIGSSDVDTIKIGANGVDKVMLGGEQLYPSATGFAITQHPQSQEGEAGDAAADNSFTVDYIPADGTAVQWQWKNPDPNDGCGSPVTVFQDISLETNTTAQDKTYVPTPSSGSDNISICQNNDRFRAVVSLDGYDDITSNEVTLSVTPGDVQEMTGDAELFLRSPAAHYYSGAKPAAWNNPSMESLPADKIFPDGQRMFIGMWAGGQEEISRAGAAKFSAFCYQNTILYSGSDGSEWKAISDAGLWCVPHLNYAANYVAYPNCTVFDDLTLTELKARADYEMDANEANADIGDKIHHWMFPLDDCTAVVSNVSNVKEIVKYIGNRGARGCGNFGTGGMYTSDSLEYRCRPEHWSYIEQTYFHTGSSCDAEEQFWRRESYLWSRQNAQYMAAVDASETSPTGKPRLVPYNPGPFSYHKPTNKTPSGITNDWSNFSKRVNIHELVVSLMGGCNGYWMYSMTAGYADECGNSQSFYADQRDTFLSHITNIVDSEFDKAILWGKGSAPELYDSSYTSPNGLTEARRSGNSAYRFAYHAAEQGNGLPGALGTTTYHTEYMVTWRDIKYKNSRFIPITNSLPTPAWYNEYPSMDDPGSNGVIVSRISGFPKSVANGGDGTNVQLKAVDILTGTEHTINPDGYIDITLDPMDTLILKIEPATGWIYPQ